MRVFLLGGEGFIGHNIIDALGSHFEVIAIDSKISPFCDKKHQTFCLDPYSTVLSSSGDVLIHLIDRIIELPVFMKEESQLLLNVNTNTYKHVLLISSAVVYSAPESDYGKRKIVLENIYKNFCEKQNISLTILRVFNPYGKYQQPNKKGSLISTLITNALKNLPTTIQDLNAKRDFIYASDLAKMINVIIQNKITGTIDAGTGKLTSIKEAVEIINDLISPEYCKIEHKDNIDKANIKTAETPEELTKLCLPIQNTLNETINFYKSSLDKFV